MRLVQLVLTAGFMGAFYHLFWELGFDTRLTGRVLYAPQGLRQFDCPPSGGCSQSGGCEATDEIFLGVLDPEPVGLTRPQMADTLAYVTDGVGIFEGSEECLWFRPGEYVELSCNGRFCRCETGG